MTEQYTPPFEGGKDPDPTTKAKTANRAKRLARRAMKKAATVKESAVPERPYRKVYEPTSAQELNPGLRAKIDAASNAQKPRPLSGMRPIGKIKLMTRELEEAKDTREYDYEGDMAMSQLKSVIANAQKLHDMLDPDTNLPEWVQSKITLAEDYIVTAANYMDGEMNEENTKRQVEPPPSAMPSDAHIKPLPKKGKHTVGSFNRFGNFTPGMKEDVEQVKENKRMGYGTLASSIKDRVARKKLAVEAHDAVGEEDADINNDGKTDKTDVYLHTKRRAIGKAISTRLATKAGK